MAHQKRIPVLVDKGQLILEIYWKVDVKLQISSVACPREGFQSTQSLGKVGAQYQPAFS